MLFLYRCISEFCIRNFSPALSLMTVQPKISQSEIRSANYSLQDCSQYHIPLGTGSCSTWKWVWRTSAQWDEISRCSVTEELFVLLHIQQAEHTGTHSYFVLVKQDNVRRKGSSSSEKISSYVWLVLQIGKVDSSPWFSSTAFLNCY